MYRNRTFVVLARAGLIAIAMVAAGGLFLAGSPVVADVSPPQVPRLKGDPPAFPDAPRTREKLESYRDQLEEYRAEAVEVYRRDLEAFRRALEKMRCKGEEDRQAGSILKAEYRRIIATYRRMYHDEYCGGIRLYQDTLDRYYAAIRRYQQSYSLRD